MPEDVAALGQASLLEGGLLLPITDKSADIPIADHFVGLLDKAQMVSDRPSRIYRLPALCLATGSTMVFSCGWDSNPR